MTTTIRTAQRNLRYPIQVEMLVEECPACGVVYGIPKSLNDAAYKSGGSIWCPNGHKLGWNKTDADRERERANQAERRLAAERDTSARWRENALQQRRSAAAYRGHLTRAKNRIANGVCPVPGCKRSGFSQVMRHIASAHPDWLHDHEHLNQQQENTP